jgi:hypothetical protein
MKPRERAEGITMGSKGRWGRWKRAGSGTQNVQRGEGPGQGSKRWLCQLEEAETKKPSTRNTLAHAALRPPRAVTFFSEDGEGFLPYIKWRRGHAMD